MLAVEDWSDREVVCSSDNAVNGKDAGESEVGIEFEYADEG